MSTYIRQSTQSYKGVYLWQTFRINYNNCNRIEKVALAGKYGFLAQIPSISKIKNSITETSRHHYKQLAKAQQTRVISTGLWDINLLYARTYLQADKKQAYRSERPCFPRKNLKSGALDSNFYTTQQSRKSRKRMPWVASVKTLAARPSSKREVHTKIPNSKL